MRPTIVKTIKKVGRERIVRCYGSHFYIKSFGNGTVTFEAAAGECINDFAKMIAGCFLPGSNFTQKLFEAYKDAKHEITKVVIIFNARRVILEPSEVTEEKIIEEWREMFMQ